MTGSALVLVGHGCYSDPWHDDAAVGHLVADELAAMGFATTLRGTLPPVLDLVPVEGWSLLVVKAAGGEPEDREGWAGFDERLRTILATGVPVLALHEAGNAFGSVPEYGRLVGGRWGARSWHPAIGEAPFRPVDDEHPVTAGLAPFTAYDETYLDMDLDAGIRPLVVVDHDGAQHPVVWQGPGPSRVVCDTLGHDARSFDSPGRMDLLHREVAWLTGR